MLVRHTLFNLVGLGAPLLVAIITIPLLIEGLGVERFGLLTLIWGIVSYFSLFDLGLGRSLTQHLSVSLAKGQQEFIPPLIWTAMTLMAGMGVFAGVLLAFITPWGVSLMQGVPDAEETKRAVYAMAWAMPFILLTLGFRGILESLHAFGAINLIRLPMGLFTFLGPLAVVSYGLPRLDYIAWVLTIGRVVACMIHFVMVRSKLPIIKGRFTIKTDLLRPLCISGGWMTVSNVLGPLMGYVDRLIIGILISTSAAAYYSTPQEIVTKLSIVPGALAATLFPRFSAHFVQYDATFRATYYRSVLLLALVLFLPVLVLTMGANFVLSSWISPDFAAHSSPVLAVFGWGMYATCLATIPYTTIQSAGNARLTAFLHMIELPVFLAMLVVFINIWGVIGAAVAWMTRNVLDAALLFYYAERYVTGNCNPTERRNQ